MKSKSGFEVGGSRGSYLSTAKAQGRFFYLLELSIISGLIVTILGAVASSVNGSEIVQLAFGEPATTVSPTSYSVPTSTAQNNNFQQGASNSYFRSMSESLSIIAGNGNNGGAASASSPVSYQRSISESLSLISTQGKVPNSYSRTMSEQASLSTGIPSSAAPIAQQQARAAPAPYSAGSNQRIEERFSLRSLSGAKADPTYRSAEASTTVYSTVSAIMNKELSGSDAASMNKDSSLTDAGEGETGDHSSGLKYVLPSLGAAQYNAGYSHVNFVLFSAEGLVFVAIALHRSRTVTSIARKIATFRGAQVHVVAISSSHDKTTLQTRVIIILFVFFSISALASISGPLFGEAAADTNNAGAAYRSITGNGLTYPKYHEYTASTTTWSSEVELPNVGQNVRSVFLLFNPINSQRVIISYDANGDIDLFRCSSSCTSATNWYNVGTVATTQSYGAANPYLPVCAAYEHTSGRLVIVYDKSAVEANDFYYKTFDGSSLSSEVGFSYIGAVADNEEIRYCDLASNPTSGSNALALIIEDATNQDAYAFIWDAAANSGAGGWPSQRTVTLTMGATSIIGNAVAIGYQTSSGAAVAFAGAGADACTSERFTTSWTTIACTDPNTPAGNGNDVKFVHAYRDPANTDNLMFCQLDDIFGISCAQIDGSTWGVWTKGTSTADGANTHAPFSFAWDPTGSIGHIFFETSGASDTTVSWSSWTDSTSSWAVPSTLTTASSVHNWFYAATNPTAADTLDKLFIKINSLFDAGIIKKNAGANPVLVGEQTLTNDQTVVTFEHQADVAFQLSTVPPTFTRSVSEPLTVTVSLGRTEVLKRSAAEQLGFTVSLGRTEVLKRSAAEQLGVAEQIKIAAVKPIARQQLAMSDTITVAQRLTRGLATEQLALTVSLAKSAVLSRPIAIQQLGLQENIAIKISKPLIEQMVLATKSSMSISKSLTEQLGLAENYGRSTTASRTFFDQFTINEKISVAVSKSMLEQLSIRIVVAPSMIVITEPLSLSDTVTKALSKPLVESLAITDSLVRSVNQSRSTGIEQLTMQDAVNRSRTVARSLSESLSLTETEARNAVQSLMLNEALHVVDTLVTSASQSRSISEQLSVSDASNLPPVMLSRSISEQFGLQESIIPGFVGFVQEQLGVSDSVATSEVLTRTISDQLGIIDTATGGTPSFVVILESLSIQDNFANIAASLNLSLSEMLMLPDSIITNQLAQFNYVASHALTIGDSVILSLQSGKSAQPAESMNVTDVASIFIVKPPPPPPSGIATMPSLTIADAPSLDLYSGLTLPMQATKVNGTWNIAALDEQGLQLLLSGIGMPVYDINAETASTSIDQMTIILPAFRVYSNVDGQISDDAMFLTPTLSRLPAGIHVIVPIDVKASIDGVKNLDQLGNATINFTPTQSVDNFTMMISLLDNNPEKMTANLPGDLAAFYVDISIVGNFSAVAPADPAFFQGSPRIAFTLTQEWAQMHNVVKDSSGVPVVSLFMLDEGTGQWVAMSNISSLPSAASNYAYAGTLPHFSTYVVTIDTEHKSSGGGHLHKFSVPLTESLLVTGGMNSGFTIGIEGKSVFKDITELLTLTTQQPQPIHQRVIRIQDVSVAVSISDIRSAMFGTAIAILNFEITNKGDTAEKLMLKYWYTDPATGKPTYESIEVVVIDAGQTIVKSVEIPFNSNGVYDVVIEAESDNGTVATTDIIVNVPWLDIYLHLLVAIAIAIVMISIIYVIRVLRKSKSYVMGGK